MKNLRKIFGIIALAALIGLTLTGCGESGNPSSPPPDKVAMPAANPPAGQVAGGTSVTLRCGTPGATIHYTTDGSAPTANSAEYFSSAPIPINAATTVKAIAVKPGMADSDIMTAAYTVAVLPANTVAAPPGESGAGADCPGYIRNPVVQYRRGSRLLYHRRFRSNRKQHGVFRPHRHNGNNYH
jgi:predicted small lipoprotein YifL